MSIDELIPFLRLLDKRSSWRRSELPAKVTLDVLHELNRYRLFEIRLWTRSHHYTFEQFPTPQPATVYGREGWYILGERRNQSIGGTLDQIWTNPMYQDDCVPEFRLSEVAADWLRDAKKQRGGRIVPKARQGQTDGQLKDPIAVVEVVKVVGRKAGRSDKLAEKMKRRNYILELKARKWYCQRADAMALFPRHRQRIEEI